jgi:hypothetical protein
MVGQELEEVIPYVPAQREAVGDHPHELPLGAQILDEHQQLQLEDSC